MFSLPYNKERVDIPIPAKNIVRFITPRKINPVIDLPQAIHNALENPVDNLSLDSFLQKGDRVVIIVSDITRYTGAELFLPYLINRINRKGISDKEISIVFSLGIHRPLTFKEQKMIVGDEVTDRIRMENHSGKNGNQLISLGKTNRGTPVIINRRVAEADKIILTGTLSFHYLAGFGGGRKSIIPGVAAYDTCVANHLLVLDPVKGGRHPQVRPGNLKGNPMHEDMMEAGKLLPPKFLFNTILSPDYGVLDLVVGNWENAFYRGCQLVDQYFKVSVPQKADLVIASCGGFPKDINFIQAHKTLDYAMNALRPGGVIILVAACKEGLGHPDFSNWFRFHDLKEMESELRNNFQINGQTAYATLFKAKSANIILLSELSDSIVHSMSITPVHSIEEALSKAYQLLGENPSTYVIPNGSVTLPWIEEKAHEKYLF